MSFTGKTLVLDTGNIANISIIQQNALNDTSEEAVESFEYLVNSHENAESTKYEVFSKNNSTCVRVCHDPLDGQERSRVKLTVKLFIYPELCSEEKQRQDIIEEFIEFIFKVIDGTYIDNLVLSVQTNEIDQVMPNLKEFWTLCEPYVDSEKVRALGVSDLTLEQLTQLYQWAGRVKPSSCEVNLVDCCVIPPQMAAYAQQKSITLLTHNDPLNDFLPQDRLRTTLDNLKTCESFRDLVPEESNTLKRKWVARYRVMMYSQGVLVSKGYLAAMQFN